MLKVRDGEELYLVGKTKSGTVIVKKDGDKTDVAEEKRSAWLRRYLATRYDRLPVVEEKAVAKPTETVVKSTETVKKDDKLAETTTESTTDKVTTDEVDADMSALTEEIKSLQGQIEEKTGKPVTIKWEKLDTVKRLEATKAKMLKALKD